MRARLALAVSGQACELREVVLKNKPQSLLQVSPKATVPVLVLPSGQVLDQSLDIMLWALAQHDPEGWLAPSEGSVQDMLAWIAECDGPFKQALDRCKYPSRYPDANVEGERAKAVAWLSTLELRLCAPRPYLFGNVAQYVNECLETGWISSRGSFISRFEEAFATQIGAPAASSVVSDGAAPPAAVVM